MNQVEKLQEKIKTSKFVKKEVTDMKVDMGASFN